MLAAGVTTWGDVNTDSTLAQLGRANAGNWDAFFQGSFDDAQVGTFSMISMIEILTRFLSNSG
jgi:hypothetical protein